MRSCLSIVVLISLTAPALTQELPTTGSIDLRLGKLEIDHAFPTAQTVKKLYDDLDFQRACQAYLWALPYTSMGEWQREQRETFGAANRDFVDYFDYKETRAAA
jgi:hypothetical protein